MDCIINYLGGSSSSHTFVIDKKRYLFNGTNKSSMVVDVSVGKVLENIRDDRGRPLFFIDYNKPKVDISEVIETVVEEPKLIVEEPIVEEVPEDIKEEPPLEEEPVDVVTEEDSSKVTEADDLLEIEVIPSNSRSSRKKKQETIV